MFVFFNSNKSTTAFKSWIYFFMKLRNNGSIIICIYKYKHKNFKGFNKEVKFNELILNEGRTEIALLISYLYR